MYANSYKVKFSGICPNNHAIIDTYKCTIETNDLIMVEDIIKKVGKYKNKPLYQEAITKKLAKHFRGARITVSGYHLGVKIISTATHNKKGK